MAIDITVNLTDVRQAELEKLTAETNATLPPDGPFSPAQYFRRFVRDWLELSAIQRADREKATLREVYARMSAEDKATVDAVFRKYG